MSRANLRLVSIHDYIIDHRGFDWPSLLREWTWLMPPAFTVWIMNRFGDLFVVLEDGGVHMLDVGAGTLTKVAENRGDFETKMDEDDNANQWLMIPLINRLVSQGIALANGQCYSYKRPPVLGGDYTVENVFVLPIAQHYGAYGSIHKQIKDLPDGTEVVFKATD